MSLLSGERQVAPTIESIRADHVNRYRLAEMLLKGTILDVACGVGYGSWLMAQSKAVTRVDSIDIDAESIAYAKQHYATDKNHFTQTSIDDNFIPPDTDGVTALEIIEHIPNPEQLLEKLRNTSKEALFSVPNERVIPFDPVQFKYHLRHYTWEEFETLVNTHYGKIKEYYIQKNKSPGDIYRGREEGWTLIVHAEAEPACD